jgi:hypothetical protein
MLTAKLPAFAFDELLQRGLEVDLSSLRAGCTVFELDPAFIEPSSIRIRDVRFCLPCDRKSGSQVPRGTDSDLTGRQRNSASVAAISFGVTRRGPSNSTTRPGFLEQLRSHTPDIGGGDHWYWLAKRLEEARNHPVFARRHHIPAGMFQKPCWPQKDKRHRQLTQRLLDDAVLCEQILFARLGARGALVVYCAALGSRPIRYYRWGLR